MKVSVAWLPIKRDNNNESAYWVTRNAGIPNAIPNILRLSAKKVTFFSRDPAVVQVP